MRRTFVGAGAVALAAAGGAALWIAQHRGASVAQPGEPIPYDQTVQLRFPADEDGDADTWVVTKRETTRDESLHGLDGSNALPAPDPAGNAGSHESARALDDLARDAWRGGDLDHALDLYAKAVEADPDDWVSHAQYGRLLAVMRDDGRARPELERAAALAPDDPQRWLDLQTLYEHSQKPDLASEARKRAGALAGGRPIVQDWAGFWTVEGSEPLP